VSGPGPRVVAIASGKGGTGKSFVAANLGTFLATLGKRVVLVDASLGAATLHDFIGVGEIGRGLGDALLDDRPLEELVVDTPVPGLRLIAGEGDPPAIADLGPSVVASLAARLGELPADYVVVDLPPGTGGFAIDLFLAADLPLVTVAPEPTAVELAYRFLKIAFRRAAAPAVQAIAALDAAGGLGLEASGGEDVADALPAEGGIVGPLDLRQRAIALGAPLAMVEELDAARARVAPFVVLNGVRSKADMDLGPGLVGAAARRLGLALRYLGHVEYDDAVWVSLRRRRPLLVEHPESRASKCVEKLTRRLLGREGEVVVAPRLTPETHYEILDIEPTASEEDIRRSHRRVRHIYARDSVIVVGLYGQVRLDGFHRRIDEAYTVLMDPARRKAYDQALFPDGIPSGRAAEALPPGPGPHVDRPPMPELPADTDFTGALLQRVRESRGLELREISERTKVGMSYLAAIEEEAFGKLPAPVYVRGFLAEYAKMLGLDSARVLETYFERFRKSVGDRPALED
jgi:flagellar biosynthesis protein FlhG